MNTVLKRKLSSVIASESIVKNIGHVKHKGFSNTINSNALTKHKPQPKQLIKPKNSKDYKHQVEESVEQSPNKRQKKTHYNKQMEPIKISSANGTSVSSLPKRIREVVWNTYNGETYTSKCYVPWCSNIINVFNYQVGHDVPESKGGTYEISNLRPICGNCNLSMGNKWTIQEWCKLVDTIDPSITIESKSNILAKVDGSTKQDIQKTEKIKQLQDYLSNQLQLDNNLNKELDKELDKQMINKNMNGTAKLSLFAVLVLALNLILF
jgi:5-methylcytosine-specific restriction endonuclease McrA